MKYELAATFGKSWLNEVGFIWTVILNGVQLGQWEKKVKKSNTLILDDIVR